MKSAFCVLVLLSCLATSLAAACPNGCSCPSPDFMSCSKAGLSSVPSPLPSTIVTIDLSFNLISSIPAKAFITAPKIRSIKLDNNKLSSLSPDAFSGLSSLQNLSLVNNGLTDTIDISVFTSIINLNLANNLFTRIPALKSATLRRLTLSANAIRSAAFPASFSSCFDLQSVKLSGNQIGAIAATDFDSLTSLSVTSLNFDANRITSVDPKALTAVGLTLENLNLNNNRLTTESLSSALKGYEKVPSIGLLSLSVSKNAITKFDSGVLAPLAYTLFNSLQMDGHRLLDLDPAAFQNVAKSLKILSLRDCGLTSLPAALSSLSSLQTLSLDGNALGPQLPATLPTTLNGLSLTRNDLQGWSGDALSRLSHLERLDLSQNSLPTITNSDSAENSLNNLADRLKMLNLLKNPFNCSCELAWFVKWATSKAGKVVQAFNTYKCAAPEKLAGKLLKNVDMSHCGRNRDQHKGKPNHEEL